MISIEKSPGCRNLIFLFYHYQGFLCPHLEGRGHLDLSMSGCPKNFMLLIIDSSQRNTS